MGATGSPQLPTKSYTARIQHRPRWTYPLDEYVVERAVALRSSAAETSGALLYLEDRGIASVAEQYALGYDNGWITFPIRDRIQDGRTRTLGVVARALPYRESQTEMRYDVPPDQGPLMYVPDWRAVEDAPEIYIAFGIIDAISLTMVGYPTVSPTLGKESFDPDFLAFHNRIISVVPDRDERASGYSLSSQLDWRGRCLRLAYPSDCDDPNDILAHHGPEALVDAVEQSK